MSGIQKPDRGQKNKFRDDNGIIMRQNSQSQVQRLYIQKISKRVILMDQDNKTKLIKFALAGLVIVILALMIWHFLKPNKTQTMQVPEVIIQKPIMAQRAEYITQTGNTVAYNSVDLVARIEGYLQEVKF